MVARFKIYGNLRKFPTQGFGRLPRFDGETSAQAA